MDRSDRIRRAIDIGFSVGWVRQLAGFDREPETGRVEQDSDVVSRWSLWAKSAVRVGLAENRENAAMLVRVLIDRIEIERTSVWWREV